MASGCDSILGGMVKGVICLPHYSAPKYMPLGANLAFAFSHPLWAVLSSPVSQPFPGLDPAKPSRPRLCWIKSSCLGWGAVTMPLPAGMWSYCSLGPQLLLTLTFLGSELADLCLSPRVAFHFISTASLPQGPVPWIPMLSRGGTPRLHIATKMRAGSLHEPYKTLDHRMPGGPQLATTATPC